MQVAIVGAGLFGQVIAEQLIQFDHAVYLFDSGRPAPGTAPSGMLMKPSWFSGLGAGVYEPALKVLSDLYEIQDVKFNTIFIRELTAMHIPREQILKHHVENRRVVEVELNGTIHVNGIDNKPHRQKYDRVIVAAGVWCNELIKGFRVPGLQGKMGVSFLWNTQEEIANRIDVWAPYKQTVVFRRNAQQVWAGDGSAIKPTNWAPDRTEQCLNRCSKLAALDKKTAKAVHGVRPYIPKMKPCFLEKISDHVWIATGGAKNGVIAAGWAAWKISEKL